MNWPAHPGHGRNVNDDHVQTKSEIRAALASVAIRPSRRLGQSFLIDGNLMRRLADSAEIKVEDTVLEIGGGTGGLTDLLVRRAGRVICVEIDERLQGILADRFRGSDGFALVRGDVLENKNRLSRTLEALLRSEAPPPGGTVKLVANLPYQVATPVVMNLLLQFPSVRRFCFTVQLEVGQRLTAPPNCKAYGPLAIMAQLLCRIETIRAVPPQAFWPQPAVDSVMMRMDVADSPLPDPDELATFAALVRGAFDHRRKTLRSALSYLFDAERAARIRDDIDESRRPETFAVVEWLAIHRRLQG